MNAFELEIFEQTSSYCELRLSAGDKPPKTRGLDRAAVDDLIALVERDYSQHAVAQKVFGAPQLRDLGTRLAAFLDGDQRWLTAVLDSPPGSTLRITAAERLRHLPWELLARDGSYLTVSGHAPLLPVRAVGTNAALKAPVTPGNRPLRVLFMATSPEGVEPVLSYEAEEAAILAAAPRTGTDLVVEESGTLDGLRFLSLDYGAGYFDVLHLSGHATIGGDGRPVFLVENELGGLAHATADQIAQAMAGRWPRLVFVSGCLTGGAPDGGTFPSMSESLVRAGAPAVLGWALPVGDVTATEFAAELYRSLADGEPLDQPAEQLAPAAPLRRPVPARPHGHAPPHQGARPDRGTARRPGVPGPPDPAVPGRLPGHLRGAPADHPALSAYPRTSRRWRRPGAGAGPARHGRSR
ncbi:CHAT domain-containing protein [Micromonospora zhanjiangensis]